VRRILFFLSLLILELGVSGQHLLEGGLSLIIEVLHEGGVVE
jgi:hypothetical protein